MWRRPSTVRRTRPARSRTLDVLGSRLERHGEGLGELPNREIARGEPGQHRAPRVVGERVEYVVHDSIFNHQVEYVPGAELLSTI